MLPTPQTELLNSLFLLFFFFPAGSNHILESRKFWLEMRLVLPASLEEHLVWRVGSWDSSSETKTHKPDPQLPACVLTEGDNGSNNNLKVTMEVITINVLVMPWRPHANALCVRHRSQSSLCEHTSFLVSRKRDWFQILRWDCWARGSWF